MMNVASRKVSKLRAINKKDVQCTRHDLCNDHVEKIFDVSVVVSNAAILSVRRYNPLRSIAVIQTSNLCYGRTSFNLQSCSMFKVRIEEFINIFV